MRRNELFAGHANHYVYFFIRITASAFVAHAEAIVICFLRSVIAM